MQSWNYAQTSNSDALTSAVASAIDQLLKLLSTDLELREHGLLLCKTLLQQAQLRILSRGVASPRNKEHVISPCLRILREIVTFDGGTLARQVYAKRDLAFDPHTIARCLTYRRPDAQEVEDIIKRPTVRTIAIRYVLAHFKFQDDGAKADLLRQGGMLRAMIDGIESDHPRIISEVLRTLLRDVIQDPGIPRRNKEFLFSGRNLVSLCQLYRANVGYPDGESEDRRPLMEEVHEFMVAACTSPVAGVMRSSGWYPPTVEEDSPDMHSSMDSGIDLGLDGIDWYNKFAKNIPIRNQILGEFILQLRPYAYDMERQLLVAIFEAAPELVAWFFRKTIDFSFVPKLTATWIGYAATLFEVVRLPVPTLFTRMSHLPPPVSIMIESIIPAPLGSGTLRQCLSSKSDLIRLFAARILAACLQKLRNVLALLKEKSASNGKLWEEASARLVEEFCRRAPTLQDVTKLYNTLRHTEGSKMLQIETTLRVSALYYEVLPQVALEENFDVSTPLSASLQEIESSSETEDESENQLRLLALSHLVKIASWSSSVFLTAKAKSLKFSPLVTLLRLLARRKPGSAKDIEDLVSGILSAADTVQTTPVDTKPSALTQLITSLRLIENEARFHAEAVYAFLDRCFHRFSKRPIGAEDDKDELMAKSGVSAAVASAPSSLLCMVILEQYALIQEGKEEIGRWANALFHLLTVTTEPLAQVIEKSDALDKAGLRQYDDLNNEPASQLSKAIQEAMATLTPEDAQKGSQLNGHMEVIRTEGTNDTFSLDISSFAPPAPQQDHPILTRYRKKDLSTLIEDDSLSSLISILSSPHLALRIQALTALRTTMSNLLSSTHLDKDTLYLLLGEIVETCSDAVVDINSKPLTGLAVTFGARAVDVLKDPTHALYIKTNEFLNKGPVWRIQSMPAWWLERVLLHPPGDADSDAAYWRELVWVLEWLVDGLRTNDDFDTLRRNGVFEKCMALFFHPSLDRRRLAELVLDQAALEREQGLQNKIRPLVLRLVVRAGLVEGATILVTGMGVLAWLGDVRDLVRGDGMAVRVVEGVRRLVLERADEGKIGEWSGGALP